MTLGEYDESGRARPIPVPGSERVIEADTIISAIGYAPEVLRLSENGHFPRNKNGTLVVDDVTLATNVPGVFAGGDVVTGASTVVQAMAGGWRAAVSIDRYLKGQDLYKDRIYTAAKRADVPRDEAAAEAAGEARGRAVMPQLGAAMRVCSFTEVNTGFDEQTALSEAKRCLRCDLEKEEGVDMSTINLTIDNMKVEVPAGATVFWAAKKAGIEIPHLCYSEGLSPTSACRLCVVEVQGARNLSASCSLPVTNNMVVSTNSPRVMAARRMVIEFLLSDHPSDCMTCEKSGTCALEKYAYELGVRKSASRARGTRTRSATLTRSTRGIITSASFAAGA